ncbi:MAG: hypothetical protein J0I63_15445, partial [Thiobacillus sp.]|nr:hypothetical protein [Thiobacillus sp.]
MEHQDAAALGQLRRAEQVERKSRAAVPLVAPDPVLRPPLRIAHCIGQEGLLGVENAAVLRAVHLAQEDLISVVGLARLEAEDRGIAHRRPPPQRGFTPVHPVVDDAERARLVVEEAVERPGDRHVQIEKQRRPLQAAKTVPQDRQLDQDVGPAALDAGVARERNDFDTRIQSAGVFGAAEKPERPAQVAADAAIEPVDV